ncbi:MAG: hypothetical protein GYA62_12245 [Bacteroidales bacterium]|nr:hypothetical protein [Bacteroidales bacterium]
MKKITFLFITFAAFFWSCNNNSNQSLNYNDSTTFNKDTVHTNRVKKIFYNVPSPIEMSSVIQRSGAQFKSDVLCSYKGIEKYTSTSKQALLLGVYGSDLSYVRLFEQIQLAINYLSSIKKLCDAIEIPEDQGSRAIQRMEKNIDNKDSLLQIISETYASADSYLKDNDRGNTATLVILGGWIESLYIATQIADYANPSNKEIVDRIGEQKYSLGNMIELIKAYPEDKDLQTYLPMLEDLKSIYDNVNIEYVKGNVVTDQDKKMTTIYSVAKVDFSKETFDKIKTLAKQIRTNIVKF